MSRYSHTNPVNRMRARQRLKSLLEEAMADALEPSKAESFHASEMYRSVESHLTLDSFEGVHIYPAPKGGWHADISLKGLPTGLPPIVGTPVSMPCATREEAERMAAVMLAVFVRRIEERDRAGGSVPAADAVFDYDAVAVFVPLEVLDRIERVAGRPPEGLAERRLDEIRRELTDRPEIDGEVMDGLSRDQIDRFRAVLAMGLLAGINRWPPPEDLPPGSIGLN